MKLTFTVDGKEKMVAVSEDEEFAMAFAQAHAAVVAECGSGMPDPYLQARVADALLTALATERDSSLGEVLSAE